MLVSLVVTLVVCCGGRAVSYPQPSWRTRHGCTVGIDQDPGRVTGTSERQLLLVCLRFGCGVAHVVTVSRCYVV